MNVQESIPLKWNSWICHAACIFHDPISYQWEKKIVHLFSSWIFCFALKYITLWRKNGFMVILLSQICQMFPSEMFGVYLCECQCAFTISKHFIFWEQSYSIPHKFAFIHLTNTFIQRDLQSIQGKQFVYSLGIKHKTLALLVPPSTGWVTGTKNSTIHKSAAPVLIFWP